MINTDMHKRNFFPSYAYFYIEHWFNERLEGKNVVVYIVLTDTRE